MESLIGMRRNHAAVNLAQPRSDSHIAPRSVKPLMPENPMSEPSPNTISTSEPESDPACRNCGWDRPEQFCPRCGQSKRDYRRSLGSVAVEFLRETLELDSRLQRTLRLLLFRPGSLTHEFSRDRRASYVSPVRLYLFASFLFFLVLSLSGVLDEADYSVSVPAQELPESQRPDDDRVEAFKAALPAEYLRKVEEILVRPDGDPMKESVLTIARTTDPERWNAIDRFFLFGGIDMFHDPDVFGERFVANMPIAMFFLLPFFALALAAFYSRKRRFFVEHLVFALHVQTFAFTVYAVTLLLPGAGPGAWVRTFCILLPFPYFLIALRRYYQEGWGWAIAKSIGVAATYSLILVPAFLISMFMTA